MAAPRGWCREGRQRVYAALANTAYTFEAHHGITGKGSRRFSPSPSCAVRVPMLRATAPVGRPDEPALQSYAFRIAQVLGENVRSVRDLLASRGALRPRVMLRG